MIKKLFSIIAVLILAACSSRMSGETTTICTDASVMVTEGDTVIVIEGYDEEIRTWTVQTTLTREQFKGHVLEGNELTHDEITDMFDYLNTLEADGREFRLVSLSDSEAIMAYVYDYMIIPSEELNIIWNVDDFESEVTLSVAIRGLEDQGAVCNVQIVD